MKRQRLAFYAWELLALAALAVVLANVLMFPKGSPRQWLGILAGFAVATVGYLRARDLEAVIWGGERRG